MELLMRLRGREWIRTRRRQDEGQKESGIYGTGTAAEGGGNLRGGKEKALGPPLIPAVGRAPLNHILTCYSKKSIYF